MIGIIWMPSVDNVSNNFTKHGNTRTMATPSGAMIKVPNDIVINVGGPIMIPLMTIRMIIVLVSHGKETTLKPTRKFAPDDSGTP